MVSNIRPARWSGHGPGEILLYDSHYAGCTAFNVLLDRLPHNVRVFDLSNREFDWRRIRGQAALEPWAIVTVGRHARYGENNAYFPHTIQSPPIKAFRVNGLHMAEIGMELFHVVRSCIVREEG